MPSIVIKVVKGKHYLQFMEGKKIVHCGRADNQLAWKRAYNLFITSLQRASLLWIVKHRLDMVKYFRVKSEAELDAMIPDICRKFSKDSKQADWLEKKIKKLR